VRWRRGSSDRHGAPVVSLDGDRWVALTNATLVGFSHGDPADAGVSDPRVRERGEPAAGCCKARGCGSQTASRLAVPVSPTQQRFPAVGFTNHAKKATMHAPIVMRSARKTSGPTVAHPSPPTAAATRIRSGVATAFAHRAYISDVPPDDCIRRSGGAQRASALARIRACCDGRLLDRGRGSDVRQPKWSESRRCDEIDMWPSRACVEQAGT
jgi:hypothetical protein